MIRRTIEDSFKKTMDNTPLLLPIAARQTGVMSGLLRALNTPGQNMTLIDRAIEIALRAHQKQVRKGTDIAYVTHPLAVGMMLARAGCREELIAAGILHDTVEDTQVSLEDIRVGCGDMVASIVEGVSEQAKSLPWEDRKARTIESLKSAPLEVRLVACADKLHNVKTIATNYAGLGEEVWQRASREEKRSRYGTTSNS